MSGYALTPLAKADIFDIWSYIAEDNQDAADSVEQATYDACAFLAAGKSLHPAIADSRLMNPPFQAQAARVLRASPNIDQNFRLFQAVGHPRQAWIRMQFLAADSLRNL
jgi:plasmid stabilization system protein ParE